MGVMLAEWTKLRTLRSTWWMLGLVVVASLGMGIWLSSVLKNELSPAHIGEYPEDHNALFTLLLIGTIDISQIVVAIMGSLTITSEFRSGMIRTSLAAVPNRLTLALNKLVVLLMTVFAVGLVCALLVIEVIGVPMIFGSRSDGPGAGSALMAAIYAALYLTMVALMAYGIGMAVRSSAAAIGITLGLLLVLPFIGNLIPSVGKYIYKFSPLTAAQQMLYLHSPGGNLTLGHGAALFVLVLWTAALLALGFGMITTRDV